MKRMDAIINKLAKLPPAIWVVAVGISYMFANLYSLVTTTDQMIAAVNDYMSQMAVEFTGFMTNLEWFFYIETAVLGLVVFEIIIAVVYRYLVNRRYVAADITKFKAVARMMYTAANIVYGVVSLVLFALPVLEPYFANIVSPLIFTLAYLAIFITLKASLFNPKYVGTAFVKMFAVYFALMGAIEGLNLILSVTQEKPNIHLIISAAACLAVLAGLGALIYKFVALPLKKQEQAYIEPTLPNQPPASPDEIFRGYGF